MTFLEEFEFGEEQPYSRILARGIYRTNFDAIRERSRTRGETVPALRHVFSFKDMRSRMPVYFARLFGRVHSVTEVFEEEDESAGPVFHLQCPDTSDAIIKTLYLAQEAVLNEIVEIDKTQIHHYPGPMERGFCGPIGIDVWSPGDRFRSHDLHVWGSTIIPGTNVQLTVRLERFEGDMDENGKTTKEYRAWMEHHGVHYLQSYA
ncbi:hypothetical protein B0H13DRAFT_2326884 [Mycena leptocephala]|nr:hypothetical protein B0H13DRAFT_2326884 [Mycena leptocephala]